MIWLLALLGTTTAEPVAVRTEPVTAKVPDAVKEPLVAVTVMSRLEGSAPVETVATLVPSAAVVAEDWVKVAPLSTANDTGMPVNAWPADVVAVAVALTVAAPVFWMLAVSSTRVRLEAMMQPPDAELALDDAQAELPAVPNGEVPASAPPPPHAAVMATAAIVVKIFSNLFMRSR
jgi:hypothetical protein